MAFGGTAICLILAGCAAGSQTPGLPSEPSPVVIPATTPSAEQSGRTIAAASAAWATPTGRISCRADATSVRCEPTQTPAWTLDPPASCTVPTPRALRLTEAGVQIDCSGGSTIGDARIGTGLTAWWQEGVDPQIRLAGVPQAALGYGSTIQVGAYVCTALQVGVSCADTRTGHGFEISTESVTFI